MRGKCDNKEGDLNQAHLFSLGFGDIREGVTLQRLGCTCLKETGETCSPKFGHLQLSLAQSLDCPCGLLFSLVIDICCLVVKEKRRYPSYTYCG